MWAINPPKSITDIKNCAVPVRLASSPAGLARTSPADALALARSSHLPQMSQYTWIDKSHPTTAVHRVLARSIGIVRPLPLVRSSPFPLGVQR